MNVIIVSMQGYDAQTTAKLVAHLRDSVGRLHEEEYLGKAVCEIKTAESFIICDALLPQFQTKRDVPILLKTLGQAFAQFVIDHLEGALLEKLIRQEYHVQDESECRKIKQYCEMVLKDSTAVEEFDPKVREAGRIPKMAEAFVQYMEENTFLHLQGFIRFRLKYYLADLREVVRYGIDEFLLDQQYQEFISLLKYFVFAQEAKIPFAHLIHLRNNEFQILDDKLEPVEAKKTTGLVLETIERDLNYEDLVVSTLIAISPETVYIHSREMEMQVIQTIRTIFAERAVLCTDCRVCRPRWENQPEHYSKL